MPAELIIRNDEHAFVILDSQRELVFCADPEGRLLMVHTPEATFKRSRYNQWYETIREPWPSLRPMTPQEISKHLAEWKPLWMQAAKKAQADSPLKTWTTSFEEFHFMDAVHFSNILDKIPILPPDAYQSLYLRIQEGCPWNRCEFCSFYKEKTYRVLAFSELETQIEQLRAYWGKAIRSRQSIFLGDANAVALPAHVILDYLKFIQQKFPEHELHEYHSFIDFFVGPRRTAAEMALLRKAGLHRLTLGLESGDPLLMERVQKAMNPSDVVHMLSAIHSGGIAMNLIFLVGLGGKHFQEAHFQQSMELLSRFRLSRFDRIYLSPLIIHEHSSYRQIAERENWEPLSETEMADEIQRWKKAIPLLHHVQISPYHICQFVY